MKKYLDLEFRGHDSKVLKIYQNDMHLNKNKL